MVPNKVCMLWAMMCALLLSSCFDDSALPDGPSVTFQATGLEQRIVNELKLYNNTLYAATDAGLYAKSLSADADWQALGLAGKNVKALVSLNTTTLLASTANPSAEEFLLYRSENSGQSWQEVSSDWGNGAPEPINDFAYHAASNTLYACGWGVVGKSTDQGLSWTAIYGNWQSVATGLAFIEINPANGNLWTGGQNAIEGFTLAKKTSASEHWHSWQNLLPSPSVGKSIAFHPSEPGTVLVGGEDGILHSANGGSSWSVVMQDHTARFYFGLEYDQTSHERVYATSWVKNFDDPQPLVLHISEDGGASWREFRHAPSGLFGGAWDMVQWKDSQNRTKLYIGLYKGGVYEAIVQ